MMKVGQKLLYWRKSKNLSTYKLAKITGISDNYLRRLQASEDAEPNVSIDIIERICEALGISVSEFLNEDAAVTYLTEREQYAIEILRRFSQEEQDEIIKLSDMMSRR